MTKQEQRWRTALHEAGHSVTAAALNRWAAAGVAYVADDARGVTVLPHGLTTHALCIATAAGRWAEKLAAQYPAPARRRRKPLPSNRSSAEYLRAKAVRECHEKATEIHYDTAGESDDIALAKYCTNFEPGHPRDKD